MNRNILRIYYAATVLFVLLDYGLDVMFVTGGLAAAEVGADPEHPDPANPEGWLADHGVAPKYAIGRLR